jgi:hypothetical protein
VSSGLLLPLVDFLLRLVVEAVGVEMVTDFLLSLEVGRDKEEEEEDAVDEEDDEDDEDDEEEEEDDGVVVEVGNIRVGGGEARKGLVEVVLAER